MINSHRSPHIVRRTRVTVPPASEPVTLADVKAQARVTTSADDAFLTALITVCRKTLEEQLGMAFMSTTIVQTMDAFPGYGQPWWAGTRTAHANVLQAYPDTIELMHRPISAVSSVKTYDISDTSTTVDPTVYQTDLSDPMVPSRIMLRRGESWPTELRDMNAVEVTYIAGFGAAVDVPGDIKQAIMQMVTFLYDSRGGCDCSSGSAAACMLPCGAEILVSQYRMLEFM